MEGMLGRLFNRDEHWQKRHAALAAERTRIKASMPSADRKTMLDKINSELLDLEEKLKMGEEN